MHRWQERPMQTRYGQQVYRCWRRRRLGKRMVRCSDLGVAVHFANPLPKTDFQNRSSESLPQIFQSASMVHTHDVSGIFTCVHVADDDGPGAAIVPRTNMPGMITIASPAGPMFTLFLSYGRAIICFSQKIPLIGHLIRRHCVKRDGVRPKKKIPQAPQQQKNRSTASLPIVGNRLHENQVRLNRMYWFASVCDCVCVCVCVCV